MLNNYCQYYGIMTRGQIKTLDKLWSEAVRTRDAKCLRCGKTSGLQGAHIFSRRSRSTRWSLDNGLTLCWQCHIPFAHKEPILFTRFVEKLKGKPFLDALQRKNNKIVKNQDYETIKQGLEEAILRYKQEVR
jgi:5-methylcytosine-specific restriction endonuclease McrA